MADILSKVSGLYDERIRDMGDGTHAEVVSSVSIGDPVAGNTSTEPLGAGQTFTGEAILSPHPDVGVSCQTDAAGTLFFDFSNDAQNWNTFPVNGFDVAAGIHEFHTAVKLPRYFRVRLVNGDDAQTFLRLYTYFGQFRQGNLPLKSTIGADSDALVIRSVDASLDLALGRFGGMIEDTKHGYVEAIDAADNAVTIWQFANDTASPRSDRKYFPETPAMLYAASSSSADTSLTFTATVIDATGEKQFVEFTTDAADGQTPVALISGIDVNRVRLTGDGQSHAGNIYVQQGNAFTSGAPDVPGEVLAYVEAGYGKTEQAAATVPVTKQWRLKEFVISVTRESGAAGSATIEFRSKKPGESWVTEREFKLSNGDFVKPVYGLVPPGGTRLEAVLNGVSDNDTSVTFEFAYDEVDV